MSADPVSFGLQADNRCSLVPVTRQVEWYRPVDQDQGDYLPRVRVPLLRLWHTVPVVVWLVVFAAVLLVRDPVLIGDAIVVTGMVGAVAALAYVVPGFGARGLHVVLAAAWASIVHLLPESRAAAGIVCGCLVGVPVVLWWLGRRRALMGEWLAAGAVHGAAAVLLLFPAMAGHG